MLSFDEVVRRILSARPDLTMDRIMSMVKLKREIAGRLLTDEGAAYMLARELGIDIATEMSPTTLKLKDLVTGASDVTVTGKVIVTYPTRTFSRKNGALGKVGRFVLQDETATVNVVLWDEKAELLEKKKVLPGMAVKVNHGYVRAGLSGRPEVNVGTRGSITALEPPASISLPLQNEQQRKIKDIKPEDVLTDFVGIVSNVFPPSQFTCSDGRVGKVARLQLRDETGQITAVLWDQHAELADTLEQGVTIRLINARARVGMNNETEVHVNSTSQVEFLRDVSRVEAKPLLRKIKDLSADLASVNVIGRVVGIGQIRSFERPNGQKGKVGDITLSDETGSVRLSLWDEHTRLLDNVKKGDAVLVEGAYAKTSIGGLVSLNLGKLGRLTVNPQLEETKNLPNYSQKPIPIAELKEGLNVSVEGTVVESPLLREVNTKDGRKLTLATLRLRDATGEIKVSFWQENAEEVSKLPLGAKLKITDAFVKVGFDGDLEVSTRSMTKFEVLETENLS